MQLEVESTGVADGLAVVVAPPEGRGAGVAVGAGHARASVTRLQHNTTMTIYLFPSIDIYDSNNIMFLWRKKRHHSCIRRLFIKTTIYNVTNNNIS